MSEREIFLEALGIPAGPVRDSFLDKVCGSDAVLRERINALLVAQPKAKEFLESLEQKPTIEEKLEKGHTSPYVPVNLIGVIIAGKYKLREKIGEGGMGAVYVAERSDQIKKLVAVKLIKPGHYSNATRARFEQERQALAIMDHPNIAKFLDGGLTDWGQPYFVMELIKGITITKYCDQEKLTIHDRLQLFIPVCHAVQHAHQKGVIHRDIKPGNILIADYDGKPVPKVIDFGVVKATNFRLTDSSIYTGIKEIIGTLEYMAPEQAVPNNLDIDTRVDIYALGVTLYELLVGTVPFSRKDFELAIITDLLRVIREVEPKKPSTKLSSSESLPSVAALRRMEPKKLTRLLTGEIDWIIMKCLEKDRGRRYETAIGLSLDIERYISDEPVRAGPPSTWYRARKFMKRHKGKLLVGALLGCSLIGGTIGTTLSMLRAIQAEQLATVEAGISKATQSFLEDDLLLQIDVEEQAKSNSVIDKDVKLATLLDRAADSINKGRFEEQPLVRASLNLTIGKSYLSLGLHDKARHHLERAVQIREQYLGHTAVDTLWARLFLARNDIKKTNYKQAEEALRTLVEDIDANPLSPRELKERGRLNWAGALTYLSELDKAETLYAEVYEARRREYSDRHRLSLQAAQQLAGIFRLQGKHQKAEELLLQTLSHQREVLGNQDPHTLRTIQTLSSLCIVQQEFSKAEKYAVELVDTGKKLYSEDHPLMMVYYNDLAAVQVRKNQMDEAIVTFEKLTRIAKSRDGEESASTIGFSLNLASCLYLKKQYKQAEDIYRQLRPLVEKKYGMDNATTRRVMRSLVSVCEGENRYAEADVLLNELIANSRASKTIPKQGLFIDYILAAQSKSRLGKGDELEKLLKEADQVEAGPDLPPYQAVALRRLKGELAIIRNDPAIAKRWLLEAAGLLARDIAAHPNRYKEDPFASEERKKVRQTMERWISTHGQDGELSKYIAEFS